MNNVQLLENLQKLIETAEILAQAIPEDAMDDNWLQETVDTALDELSKTANYLKDKYDLDISDFTDAEYLSNMEFEEFDDATLLEGLEDEEFDTFDFEEEDE
jgi:hypothetical protein